jgi:predicted CXXCH cytochrome family protein
MIRFFFFISAILILIALLFDSVTTGKDIRSNACVKCHQEIQMQAIGSPYQHSIVNDGCTLCHDIQERADEKKTTIKSSVFQKEGVVYLGILPEDKEYQIDATVSDVSGISCEPKNAVIIPKELRKHPEEVYQLKWISDVRTEKIKKSLFAEAVISWVTNVPATSEVEYGTAKKYTNRFTSGDIYTKKHLITLNRLRHKRKYRYRIISRDISGNILQSKEYIFDTSNDFTGTGETMAEDRSNPPFINNMKAFKIEGRGIYLEISANKPAKFSIDLKEVKDRNEQQCDGSPATRYSTINACLKCHPQDSSHPVGVRSGRPGIVVPDDAATIEKGLITCTTCHYPHGGEELYFARMDFKNNMCAKCHVGYIK